MNCVIDKMTSPRSLLMIQRAKELQKSDSSYISLPAANRSLIRLRR